MLPFLPPVCDQHNTQHQTTSPVLSSAWSESLWLISWMNHCREVSVLPVTSSHIAKQTSGHFSWFVSSESFLYNQIKYNSTKKFGLRWHSTLVFGRFLVQVLAKTLTILTGFCGFPQSGVRTVPRLGVHLPNPFQFIHHHTNKATGSADSDKIVK